MRAVLDEHRVPARTTVPAGAKSPARGRERAWSSSSGSLIGLAVGPASPSFALRVAGSRLAAARRDPADCSITEAAEREAEALRREAQIEAREQSVRLRAEIEQEVAERRTEILKIEERVVAKEEEIDRKLDRADAAGTGSRRPGGALEAAARGAEGGASDAELTELERICGMTVERGQDAPARALRGIDPPRARATGAPGRGGSARRGKAPGAEPRRRRAPARCREPRRRRRLCR